jgi:DsbC/DsbD-like thiol-disulfide interchange protein
MTNAFALIACLSVFALPASAQSKQTLDTLDATLLPGWQTESGTHMAGLTLQLAPGWKTYWRSPGEAGIPPLFNWQGSENLKSVQVYWPRPAVFHTNGMQSIGYHDAVTLPLEVTAIDPGKPVRLHATIDLGVCKDICLPAALDLTTDLVAPGIADASIAAALAAQPDVAPPNAGAVTCQITPIADGLTVTATLRLTALGLTETVAFETTQPDIWVAEATTTRTADKLVSVTDMVAPTAVPFDLDPSLITITVLAGDGAVEFQGCPLG